MEQIEWRVTKKRGRYAQGDVSLTLSAHTGRRDMLRIAFMEECVKDKDWQYVAISDFTKSNDKIYFVLTKERITTNQNKLHCAKTQKSKQVLFTLKDGEGDHIKDWCDTQYNLIPYDENIYYIERSK